MMKKVLFNKRKFNWGDLGRICLLLVIHIIGFLFYLLIVLALAFIYQNVFTITFWQMKLLLIYPLTIGIIINVLLHITYTELGNSWIRLAMWIHTALIAVLISLIIFLA